MGGGGRAGGRGVDVGGEGGARGGCGSNAGLFQLSVRQRGIQTRRTGDKARTSLPSDTLTALKTKLPRPRPALQRERELNKVPPEWTPVAMAAIKT